MRGIRLRKTFMGVKLLNDCSHKINRAPGHSSSPRQKWQQAGGKKVKKAGKDQRNYRSGKTLDRWCQGGCWDHSCQDTLSPLTHSLALGWKKELGLGTISLYMKRYNRSYSIPSTLRPSSPPKCPHHLPTGFTTEIKGLCSSRALQSLFTNAFLKSVKIHHFKWVFSSQKYKTVFLFLSVFIVIVYMFLF